MPATHYGTTVPAAFSPRPRAASAARRPVLPGHRRRPGRPAATVAFEQPVPPLAGGHEQRTQRDARPLRHGHPQLGDGRERTGDLGGRHRDQRPGLGFRQPRPARPRPWPCPRRTSRPGPAPPGRCGPGHRAGACPRPRVTARPARPGAGGAHTSGPAPAIRSPAARAGPASGETVDLGQPDRLRPDPGDDGQVTEQGHRPACARFPAGARRPARQNRGRRPDRGRWPAWPRGNRGSPAWSPLPRWPRPWHRPAARPTRATSGPDVTGSSCRGARRARGQQRRHGLEERPALGLRNRFGIERHRAEFGPGERVQADHTGTTDLLPPRPHPDRATPGPAPLPNHRRLTGPMLLQAGRPGRPAPGPAARLPLTAEAGSPSGTARPSPAAGPLVCPRGSHRCR